MARTLVFEGCPACNLARKSNNNFGEVIPMAETQKELVMKMIQGGAVGAGGATIIDIVLPRVPGIGTLLPVAMRPLLTGAIAVGAALALYKKQPEIATGIGIGGVSVAAYKLAAIMLGRVVSPGLSGLGEALAISEVSGNDVEIGPTQGAMGVMALNRLNGMGVVVPTEMAGYGQDEFIVD